MFDHAIQKIRLIEAEHKSLENTLAMLRTLTLDEFGELLLTLPNEEFPHLSSILPSATPDEVQVEWTGSCGVTLLRQSVSFLNFVAAAYTEFSGRPLRNVNVLDFGCGWGRLLRLLAFYNNPEFNFGCDAWPVSLDHARQSHVLAVVKIRA